MKRESTDRFYKELEKLPPGREHVAAVGDLQTASGLEVFHDLRYQRIHMAYIGDLRIVYQSNEGRIVELPSSGSS